MSPTSLAVLEASDHAVLISLAIAGAFFVLQVIDKGTSVWRRFKADPPASEVFATKDELRNVELRIEKRIGENIGSINTRIGHMEKTMGSFVKEMSRSLGKIEGRLEEND